MKNQILALLSLALLNSCTESSEKIKLSPAVSNPVATAPEVKKPATASEILSRPQVPILCYHHIREIRMASKANKGYEVTVKQFKDQMKALADSGYQSILPDDLYDYLQSGKALPTKPVMISFDDTSLEHFTVAKTVMDEYGFKGVFFIMTISIGRPNYMSKEQIKQLSDEGHAIASHTWDHHRVDKYSPEDWEIQLSKSRSKLEEITGKKIEHFAYPFGIWSQEGIPELQKRDFKLAFQLSTSRDSLQPLHTVRRMIVSPEWSAAGMIKVMNSTFRRG